MSIHEQIRADKAAKAEQRRADAAHRAEQRRADRAAQREQDRADREHHDQLKATRKAARREQLSKAVGWVRAHPVDVLMAAIIVVPGLLAWSAMAAYGRAIYGGIGTLLPLFTEAAMWAFAFKLHQARHHDAPTGRLQLGVWTFTTVAAALNYGHGHMLGGVVTGLVMATVSVGGVVAHQIITASPMRSRRSRAERRAARIQAAALRRAARMERAAVAQAVGELAEDGSVSLRYTPGPVTLSRRWTGRVRLDRTTRPGLDHDGPDATDTASASVAEGLGAEIEQWLSDGVDAESIGPRSPSSIASVDAADALHESRVDRDSISEPNRRSIDRLRRELHDAVEAGVEVDVTSAESIRKTLRCAPKAARQLRDEWNRNDGSAGVTAA